MSYGYDKRQLDLPSVPNFIVIPGHPLSQKPSALAVSTCAAWRARCEFDVGKCNGTAYAFMNDRQLLGLSSAAPPRYSARLCTLRFKCRLVAAKANNACEVLLVVRDRTTNMSWCRVQRYYYCCVPATPRTSTWCPVWLLSGCRGNGALTAAPFSTSFECCIISAALILPLAGVYGVSAAAVISR